MWIGRNSANAKLGSKVLSFAARCYGSVEPVETEARLIHHTRRKGMRVTQHCAAIVDHLGKELIGREIAVVWDIRHVERHNKRAIPAAVAET